MTHDKKNEGGIINFTLLSKIGEVQINQAVTKEKILESLDFLPRKFWRIKEKPYLCSRKEKRDVAQPGRVRVWGACGRKFESCHPDNY